jgi:hypothetical protein
MIDLTKPTCDGRTDPTGKCDASHSLHCCHFAVSMRIGRLSGWRCVKCGKRSQAWTEVQDGEVPAI